MRLAEARLRAWATGPEPVGDIGAMAREILALRKCEAVLRIVRDKPLLMIRLDSLWHQRAAVLDEVDALGPIE
jgi:hypothetical protein